MFARRLADTNTEKRTHPSNPSSWLLDAVGSRTYTGKNISEEDALSITAVWCACQILAGTIGSLPLPLYERIDIGKERAVDHPLYNLLKLKPNSEMSAISYRESMMLHLMLWGNHYSEISRNNANVITELWPLLPYKMSWKRIDGKIIYIYNLPDGTQALLPKERVLHISGLSPNGLFGYNMVTKGKEALGISAALEEYAGRYFSNNAKPPVVIEHPGDLGKDAANNLKTSWNEVNAGLSNSHRVAILEEGMKLKEFGSDPENSQVLQSRKFSVNEVARLTNMPPHMLKDLDKATFSNIEEQGIEFVTYTLRTWLVRLEQGYSLQLLSDSERDTYFWEHLIDGLLRGDTEKRWGAYDHGFRSGVWSPNDIRAMENKNKVKGGDQRFIDGNLFPLEHAADVMIANKVTKLDNMAGNNDDDPDDSDDDQGEDEKNSKREFRGDFAQKETADFYSDIERIERNFQPLLEIVAQLVLNKEVNSINRAAQKFLNTRGGADFRIWMETFYSELPEFMRLRMLPTQKVFLQQVSAEVGQRLGTLKGWTMELEQWTQSYMDVYIKRHIGSSMGQLDKILKGVEKDVYEEITKRTAQWQAKRASLIAKDEMVRESQAMVRHMAEQAGVKRMVWRTDSDPCPFCAQLNGKTVSIDKPFFLKGDPLTSQPPEGQKESTIYMRSDKFHPPIHSGCECRIIPIQ